jgi:hypothetical protein
MTQDERELVALKMRALDTKEGMKPLTDMLEEITEASDDPLESPLVIATWVHGLLTESGSDKVAEIATHIEELHENAAKLTHPMERAMCSIVLCTTGLLSSMIEMGWELQKENEAKA